MGTPAFPNLGNHCTVEDCRQIDFLPFTCDSCHRVYCLDHRIYGTHQCPKASKNDVTVVICPICAKGVRLIPDENPNITWESHVNTECDPSNYEKATKKKKCPVPRCKEILTFSNTIKCKDCLVEHCLKHRFGADHNCSGPKDTGFQFSSFLNRSSRRGEPNQAAATSSSSWASTLFRAASSARTTAEAGIAKLSSEFNQSSLRTNSSNNGHSGSRTGIVEPCPLCNLRFSSVTDLVNHVQKVHERNEAMKSTIDVCPKCSKGFRDPVALVDHVEREHKGTSKA